MENKFTQKLENRKGFTLIELLVVIAIIGLLATMSVVALSSAREKARDSRRLSDVKQIQTALEMYYSTAGQYPGSISPGGSIATSGETFMAEVPVNPQPASDGSCDELSNDDTYGYNSSANNNEYVITYCLGNSTNDIDAGTNCATPAGIAATSTGASGYCETSDNQAADYQTAP